jgi:release factor glutamine methyltransferase
MAIGRLEAAGIEEARLDSQLLAAHVLLTSRTFVLTHPDQEINEYAAEALLQRREAREPLPYILGYREFYGRRFSVAPGVLIPRPETEHVIEAALGLSLPSNAVVLDVGTGSGVLAVTLALEHLSWQVIASDYSREALRIARQNAMNLNASVSFARIDGLTGWAESPQFDLVVSNPPYIRRETALMPEVEHYEPSIALYGGDSGLDLYNRWIPSAFSRLRPNGWLAVEIGYDQGPAVVSIFKDTQFTRVELLTDLAGNDRVVIGCRA